MPSAREWVIENCRQSRYFYSSVAAGVLTSADVVMAVNEKVVDLLGFHAGSERDVEKEYRTWGATFATLARTERPYLFLDVLPNPDQGAAAGLEGEPSVDCSLLLRREAPSAFVNSILLCWKTTLGMLFREKTNYRRRVYDATTYVNRVLGAGGLVAVEDGALSSVPVGNKNVTMATKGLVKWVEKLLDQCEGRDKYDLGKLKKRSARSNASPFDQRTLNLLLAGVAEVGDYGATRSLLARVTLPKKSSGMRPTPDIVTYRTLIRASGRSNKLAHVLFEVQRTAKATARMQQLHPNRFPGPSADGSQFRLDNRTLGAVVMAYSDCGRPRLALSLLENAVGSAKSGGAGAPKSSAGKAERPGQYLLHKSVYLCICDGLCWRSGDRTGGRRGLFGAVEGAEQSEEKVDGPFFMRLASAYLTQCAMWNLTAETDVLASIAFAATVCDADQPYTVWWLERQLKVAPPGVVTESSLEGLRSTVHEQTSLGLLRVKERTSTVSTGKQRFGKRKFGRRPAGPVGAIKTLQDAANAGVNIRAECVNEVLEYTVMDGRKGAYKEVFKEMKGLAESGRVRANERTKSLIYLILASSITNTLAGSLRSKFEGVVQHLQ
eukprot:scaffold7096_cov253-Pinguiococcus_pyrenoidosus.AAC.7